jgi:hypothetical protein
MIGNYSCYFENLQPSEGIDELLPNNPLTFDYY